MPSIKLNKSTIAKYYSVNYLGAGQIRDDYGNNNFEYMCDYVSVLQCLFTLERTYFTLR